MNRPKGMWAIAACFLAYAALYWYHVIAVAMPLDAQLSYFFASCSVICMVIGLLLSARPRAVEGSFGGLDRMYTLHKYLGVASLLLFIAHYATVPGGGPEGDAAAAGATVIESAAPPSASEEPLDSGEEAEGEEELPIDLVGLIAMIGLTLLIIVTLNRKIPYHRWIPTHRFMGLFFAVVSIHVLLVRYDGEEMPFASAPGAALSLLLLAGLTAYAYKQLIHPRRGKHAFTVAAVNRLERATEVVLKPRDRVFPFEPGQFAFITVDTAGFREAHPFTISSGAGESTLRFTMKVLGDYTRRVRGDLATGTEAAIEGPYGRFMPLRGPGKQVWIAGGIGITPFLSVLRTMTAEHGKSIRLYYCVRAAREALFLGEMEARAAELDGVTIKVIDSDTGARIDAAVIERDLGGGLGDWSYYFCGPKPMTVAVSGGLAERGVPARHMHAEEFEFR